MPSPSPLQWLKFANCPTLVLVFSLIPLFTGLWFVPCSTVPSIACPELSFAVNKVCQFMATSFESPGVAIKWILQYLKIFRLWFAFHPASVTPFSLSIFCNAECVFDLDDWDPLPVQSFIYLVNLISWWCYNQVVAILECCYCHCIILWVLDPLHWTSYCSL